MKNSGPVLRKILKPVRPLLLLIFLLPSLTCSAQYFGQNKVRYKNLKFKVYQSPHFELYAYMKNDSLIKRFLQESEIWYELHQQVFRDTFSHKNPIILYANHSDFEQTTAISGDISIGTGGITEGMKNRVVMPMMEIYQQTRHVIGHELVHAFQYHSLIEGDSTNLENIGNLPLWMVEGMAEYLSVGKRDAFTSMWMRDAYLNHDIPSLNDLTNSSKYFPYRYGEAFWSYLGSTYGDTVIVPFFKATAKFGYQMAIKRTFGYDEQTLSNLWKNSIETTYKPFLKDTSQVPVGTKILDNKNAGDMNVAPAISPDGKYVAFLSEKELLSIDLFLADAKTGKILKTLGSKATNSHIDEFSFIESSGAWSPDSRRFAFTIFSQGRNKLLITDVKTGKTILTQGMKDIGEFSNLTWSPDGENIAFTGLKQGQSDLYMYNLRTKKITQLTNDKYSDYQPNFSWDGKYLVFSSDRTTFDNAEKGVDIPFNLAVMNLSTKAISNITVFNGANNLNPQFSPDNSQIYFLSDRDGFRNLYRYTIADGKVEQLTDYFTGISGITEYSPALSVSKNGDILYSYYRYQRYTIYNAKDSQFKPMEVNANAVNFEAAYLPPSRSGGVDIINPNLDNFERFSTIPSDSVHRVAYRPQFKLDYISSNGVGASVGQFGAGLSSGIQGIFSDILGRNQIYASAAVNGEIYDFGGQVAYMNQQSRINWGVGLSHIPYISAYQSDGYVYDNNNQPTAYRSSYDIIRTFEDELQVFASYPFSRVLRFEAGASYAFYYNRVDRFSDYYDYTSGYYLGSDRKKVPLSEANQYYGAYGFNLNNFNVGGLNAAFVGDNAFMGVTSPLNGYRYRVGISQYLGDYDFGTFLTDGRKYFRIKPVTLAGRFYSATRFGKDQESLSYGQFIGYPYLIRGYEYNSFYKHGNSSENGFDLSQLVGSKIAVANFEVRLPFTGPEKLSAIPSKFFFSDLNAFFDIGLAYNNDSKVAFRSKPKQIGSIPDPTDPTDQSKATPVYDRVPAMSAGVSLRVNVFGYFVLEPYFAIPFQRSDVNLGVFGLTFAPGW